MALVVAMIIGFVFLESPWRYLVIAGGALIELAEIGVWLRWRKVRSTTGAEGLVGAHGVTLSDCDPSGQVKVKGQIWKATCPEGVATGAAIEVASVDGLTLEVRRR